MELRTLTSKDIMPMCRILSKIGVKEFKDAFADIDVTADTSAIGMGIVFEIGDVILSHLPDCEKDVYAFLADLTGETVDALREMSLADFAQLIIDLVQKDEFKDFFKVVSKLFSSVK